MNTPPPAERNGKPAQRRVRMTREQKDAILENFDLEIAHRLSVLQKLNATLLQSFLTRQETEIARIPLELRKMTVRELGEKWSGGMQSVVESLARGRLEEVEREGERVDEGLRGELSAAAAAAGKGAKEGGKRKRQTTASQLSSNEDGGRIPKNARKNPPPDPTATLSKPSSASSSRPKPKPNSKASSSSSSRLPTQTSSLPSAKPSSSSTTYTLPSTSFSFTSDPAKAVLAPRRPRRGESVALSTNGSPLILRAPAVTEQEAEGEFEEDAEGAEEVDGLLDEEEVLKRIQHGEDVSVEFVPDNQGGKGKSRASQIRLSSSYTPHSSHAAQAPSSPSLSLVIPISLPDGRTLRFNALADSPTKLDEILRGKGSSSEGEGGGVVSEEERKRIKEEIDRRVRRLGEVLGKWTL